jgi:spore coat protein U-like protein
MTFTRTFKTVLSIAVVGFLALGFATTPAFALTTQTTTFQVTATVQGTCTIAATNLAFGIYTGAVINQTSTVTINCNGGTLYNVTLDAGLSTGATVTTRKMKGVFTPANVLAYSMSRDAAHTLNWGATIGTDGVAGTGSGAAQPLTVYGQIAAGSLPNPDSYADTITATVTY